MVTIELIEGEPDAEQAAKGETVTVAPIEQPGDDVITMSYQSWLELGKRHAAAIAELEAQLKAAHEKIASRDEWIERMPKLAVEVENTRVAELESRLAEAEARLNAHRRFHGKVGCPGGEQCYVCTLDEHSAWPQEKSNDCK